MDIKNIPEKFHSLIMKNASMDDILQMYIDIEHLLTYKTWPANTTPEWVKKFNEFNEIPEDNHLVILWGMRQVCQRLIATLKVLSEGSN